MQCVSCDSGRHWREVNTSRSREYAVRFLFRIAFSLRQAKWKGTVQTDIKRLYPLGPWAYGGFRTETPSRGQMVAGPSELEGGTTYKNSSSETSAQLRR